jgi:hypothetical protein
MIYICYIIYRDYMAICMLTVGDDELAVRDDNNTSSEVAEGEPRAGRLGEVTRMGLETEWDM